MATSMHVLSDELSPLQIIEYVKSCYHPNVGGFSPTPRHDPQILCTLSAIQIACILDAKDQLDVDAICKYISGLQNKDGSFCGDKWGEVDTRFSFGAVAALSLLGRIGDIDLKKVKKVKIKSICWLTLRFPGH